MTDKGTPIPMSYGTLARPRSPYDWQPMETAPKDGTKILIWAGWSFEEPDFHIAAWETDHDPGKGDPPRMRWCTAEAGGAGSTVAYDDSDVKFWKPLDTPS